MKRCLIFFIFIFFIGYGCKNKEADYSTTRLQSEVLNFFPSKVLSLSFINTDEIRNTKFWNSYFESSLKNDKNLSLLFNYEKKTGINIIDQIFSGSISGDKKTTIVSLKNDLPGFKNYIKKSGSFYEEKISDEIIYRGKYGNKVSLFFQNDSLVIINDDFHSFKDTIGNKKKLLINSKIFQKEINKTGNKNHYWLLTNDKIYAESLMKKMLGNYNDFPAQKLLRSVEKISLSVSFLNDVEIETRLGCSNSKDALLLSSAIKGALAMDLLSKSIPSLNKTFDKVEVKRNKSDIYLNVILDKDDMNGLNNFVKNKNLDIKL